MKPQRIDRLVGLLRVEISKLMQTLKDPGIAGFVTLTDVELSKDIKQATVYYSVLGTEEQKKSTGHALERSSGYIRRALMERLCLKRVPSISFAYDTTPERAERICKLLDKIAEENGSYTERQNPPGRPEGGPDSKAK